MVRSDLVELWMWFVVGMMQIAFIAFIGSGLHFMWSGWAVGWPALTSPAWVWPLLIATMAWVVIFLFWGGINMFTVRGGKYIGIVLENGVFGTERPMDDSDITILKPTRSLVELGPGNIHPKFPTQRVWYVDLRRQKKISRTVNVFPNGKQALYLRYYAVTYAARGYLCNLVRNTDDEAESTLVAKIESGLIKMCAGMSDIQILKGFDTLAEKFANVLQGDGVVSEPEQQAGLIAEDITAQEASRSEQYQESIEALAAAQNTGKAIKALVKAGVLEAQAAKIIAAQQKIGTYTAIDISGLANLQTVGGGINITAGAPNKPQDKKPRKGKEDSDE